MIPLALLFLTSLAVGTASQTPPHIIFIVADDLGWNDVGFHGSRQIPTPNIDALAYSGLILNNYYVQPICTPSRSAIMTGRHPIHTGLQHTTIGAPHPYGLPLKFATLPEYLRHSPSKRYVTRAIGKWHLGFFHKEYTPTYRGFDTHYGYWSGRIDYYDHTADEENNLWGYDFRRGMEVEHAAYGQYATDLFTAEAVSTIQSHNTSTPLFLYLAHLAVHSANPYAPLQAPREDVERFPYIEDEQRRIFAGMMSRLDAGVGEVVSVLSERGMLDNCVLVFTTDNGGPAGGFNSNRASNWPLRGVKASMWEGGVRGAAYVWSPLLKQEPGTVAQHLMAVEDWLPTLVAAAGGDPNSISGLDGVNHWPCLVSGHGCPRKELLHNIDPVFEGAGLRSGDWKILHKPSNYDKSWDRWFGPSGINETAPGTDLQSVLQAVRDSPAGKVVTARQSTALDGMRRTREQAQVNCTQTPPIPRFVCRSPDPLMPCLFNVMADPCEQVDLSSQYPLVVKAMLARLEEYRRTAVPVGNKPWDPRADPKYWSYNWNNWMDYPPPVGVNTTSVVHDNLPGHNDKLFDFFNRNKDISDVNY